jgi:hydroxymethylglutaryl-CoA synthase
MVGIISFGYYIPKFRVKTGTASEKVVGGLDEDAITIAVEAGIDCLTRLKSIDPRFREDRIQAIYIGSESHPYAVNPSASSVGQFLGINNFSFGADFEFACKAGTSSLIAVEGLAKSKKIKYGLAIGSDKAQGKKGDVLEKVCAAGGAAFLVGSSKKEIIAEIIDSVSFQSDTPDFWRRDGEEAPSHAGRFSGEPAYFFHIEQAVTKILKNNKKTIKDFDQIIFHQPNEKFPLIIAKKLGATEAQMKTGYYVKNFGNSYSANSLLGLCKVLEVAKPNDLILVVSYGSGAGSDAIFLKATKNILHMQACPRAGGEPKKFEERMKEKIYVN